MDKNYKIVDNALDLNNFENLKNHITSKNFPWFFNDYVAYFEDSDLNEFYYTHIVYSNHQIQTTNETMNLINPLLELINPKALLRIKINAYPNVNKFVCHQKHIDFTFDHNGALFSLNTCNGYTELEEGVKVNSVENRLLLFDSGKSHNSTNCTDQKIRYNININYF